MADPNSDKLIQEVQQEQSGRGCACIVLCWLSILTRILLFLFMSAADFETGHLFKLVNFAFKSRKQGKVICFSIYFHGLNSETIIWILSNYLEILSFLQYCLGHMASLLYSYHLLHVTQFYLPTHLPQDFLGYLCHSTM